jgi:hypothetical protein
MEAKVMTYEKPYRLMERIPKLKARITLLEKFLSLGLKQADVVARSGRTKDVVSLYFSGRSDNTAIESIVNKLIAEAEARCD